MIILVHRKTPVFRKNRMGSNIWILIGALFGFLGVALGAFGAHGLSRSLSEKSLSVFQTAVQYQMIHALALIGLGIWSANDPDISTVLSGSAFTLGTVLFSGSLYVLALTDIRIFGMITPVGGVLFLVGWIALGVSALRR
jgi:uncharacterized membrane protein YgdD (TMEM256/DUF423 family)